MILLAAALLAALFVWSFTLKASAQEGISCLVDADCPPGCVCFEEQCWLPGQAPTATSVPETPAPTTTSSTPPAAIDTAYSAPASGCIPVFAGAPVRMCESGSGSGWWLQFYGWGRSATGPHVAFPEVYAERGTETGVVLQAQNPLTGAPLLVWYNAQNRIVVVLSLYADDKVYVFAVNEGRRVWHLYW